MFAFLALAGDLGAMVSPAMVGSISEVAGGNLKSGLLGSNNVPRNNGCCIKCFKKIEKP